MPMGRATGGRTRYILENWRFIDKNLFQFDFATFLPEQPYERELLEQGCLVHRFSCYAEDDYERFCAEFSASLDTGYDAVHLHTSYWHDFVCEELAIKKKVPIIAVHAHNSRPNLTRGTLPFEHAIAAHMKKRLEFNSGLATHFFACSGPAADFLYGQQIPKKKIRILKNAIDTDRFAFDPLIRLKYRRNLGLDGIFTVGHVGRFAYQKNHAFLVEVFAEILKEIPAAALLLVGGGELMEETRQAANRLGITEKVLFLGERADIAELYQAMDMFAFPSRFEGLPFALLEAQTAGLKCLAGDGIAAEAKVTDNLRFLPLDVDRWSEAVVNTAKEKHLRRDCSAVVAAAGYSIREQVKVLERIYSGEK